MARSLHRDQSISQKNNASSIGNKRGMARRAKRNSNKRDRQALQKDLNNRINGFTIIELITAIVLMIIFAVIILVGIAVAIWLWRQL